MKIPLFLLRDQRSRKTGLGFLPFSLKTYLPKKAPIITVQPR